MHSDYKYIQALKDNNPVLIQEIYDNFFGIVEHLVHLNQKTIKDADDLFQDTLMAIYDRVRDRDFTLTCQFNTLVYAFAKRILLNILRKKGNKKDFIPLSEYERQLYEVPDFEIDIDMLERQKKFDRAFGRLDKKSRHLIELYIAGYSMAEIAQKLGFKSAGSVRVQKVRCIEKLKYYYEKEGGFPLD